MLSIANNLSFEKGVKLGYVATIPAEKKYTMNKQNHMDAKKRLKLGTCYCPVCDKPRQKGNHAQCSRITQLKGMTERGDI